MMKKHVLSILLCLVLCCSLLPVAALAADMGLREAWQRDQNFTLADPAPWNLEELKQVVDVTDPRSVAAYWVWSVNRLVDDYDDGMAMMKYLFADIEPYGPGYTEGGMSGQAGWDSYFNERLSDSDYSWLPRAYFEGASAENGFRPGRPLTIELYYNSPNTKTINKQTLSQFGRLNIVYWVRSHAGNNQVNITLSRFDGSDRWYVTSGTSSTALFYDQREAIDSDALALAKATRGDDSTREEHQRRYGTARTVTSLRLNQTSLTLKKGETAALTATVRPTNATDKTVTWKSSRSTVASVDQNGVVTAKRAGTANITATANDGSGKKATCTVTVTQANVAVTRVTIAPKPLELAVGESAALTATVRPADATDKTVTWKSSRSTVASVDQNGIVTAKRAGTATITATANDGSGKKATCTVTVTTANVAVTRVTIAPKPLELAVGESAALTATVRPADATDKTVTWKSSRSTVASVDQNGIVTAKRAGTATITATANDGSGKKATCTVTVTQANGDNRAEGGS